MIGASGAISGILGFYFLWFPRNQVRLLWFLPPFFFHAFEISARIVLGFYLVVDNLLPFLVAQAQTGVAHGAHIGGFVAGIGAAWVLDRRLLRRRPTEYKSEVKAEKKSANPVLIAEAIDRGDLAEAGSRYFALPKNMNRGILSPQHSIGLAQWLRENRHPEAALIVLRRHIRDYPNGPGIIEAHVSAGQILLNDLGQPAAAYQYFLATLDLGPPPELEEIARRGVAAIESLQKRQVGHLHRRRSSRRNQ
jgi:hypothetical protein